MRNNSSRQPLTRIRRSTLGLERSMQMTWISIFCVVLVACTSCQKDGKSDAGKSPYLESSVMIEIARLSRQRDPLVNEVARVLFSDDLTSPDAVHEQIGKVADFISRLDSIRPSVERVKNRPFVETLESLYSDGYLLLYRCGVSVHDATLSDRSLEEALDHLDAIYPHLSEILSKGEESRLKIVDTYLFDRSGGPVFDPTTR